MDTEAFAALARLYAEVDRAVAARRVRCHLTGRCCDFPRSGEILYATALETAWVLAAGPPPPPEAPAWCPYYRGGRCRIRSRRPLGCRLYFCAPRYRREVMPALGEWAQGRLRRLHETLGLPYRYAPFVAQLRDARP